MLEYRVMPLKDWPNGRTQEWHSTPFKAGWASTLDLLEAELRHLKAKNVVLQLDVRPDQIRNDGMLKGDARVHTARVILSFDCPIGELQYPCARFTEWRHNVRAVALALEALRKIDRYGVTQRAEQYTGWARIGGPVAQQELPEMTPQEAGKVLSSALGEDRIAIHPRNLGDIYRKACTKTHPDVGGSADAFRRVQQAKTVLDKHFSSVSV